MIKVSIILVIVFIYSVIADSEHDQGLEILTTKTINPTLATLKPPKNVIKGNLHAIAFN